MYLLLFYEKIDKVNIKKPWMDPRHVAFAVFVCLLADLVRES